MKYRNFNVQVQNKQEYQENNAKNEVRILAGIVRHIYLMHNYHKIL